MPYNVGMQKFLALLAISVSLAACGGGSQPGTPNTGGPAPVEPVTPVTPPPATKTALDYYYKCEHPRTGSPDGFLPYPDQQGTLADEKAFLRLWMDDTYLWYKELPQLQEANYDSAIAYFHDLKTPQLTASGAPRDRFHFTYPSAQWDEMQRGVDLGYGLSWMRNVDGMAPRTWRVAIVEPDSPAKIAGLQRGDLLLQTDGIDFVNGVGSDTVAKLNAAITPHTLNEEHSFVVQRGSQTLTFVLKAAKVDMATVQNTEVLDTPTGKVGYLTFNSHNTAAEKQLIDAFTVLREAQVKDLVLDLRYNGGGLLSIASQVAYMVAGPERTAGKTFDQTLANDKTPPEQPLKFLSKSIGYPTSKPALANQALPTLGLARVTILTGPGTCSASEAIINGLRGVDVEVNLVGDQTCGKPYAFTPMANCSTTYFAIQYQGVNAKGFGDFADGFAPTCAASDDFSHALGDQNEGVLSAALSLRATGTCPVAAKAARLRTASPAPQLVPVRPAVSEIAIVR
jgi:hypothetical protein